MAEEILTFEKAIEKTGDSRKTLLLGNGFSMAYDRNIFHYESLYKTAEKVIALEMPEVSAAFKRLGLWDFESVIRILENGAQILPIYLPADKDTVEKVLKHATRLKNILIDTIAQNHPDKPNNISIEKFAACRKFLSHFLSESNDGRVYSFNYDLLLYWATMHKDADGGIPLKLSINDGFGKDEPDIDYITWQNEDYTKDQRIYYLHGAMHLFDSGTELEKYTWINKGISLVEQIREAIGKDKFPLFVAEGGSSQKLNKIKHQPYLYHCYKSFLMLTKGSKREKIKKSIFIFGHSLNDNDWHIIEKIAKGAVPQVFISVYGDKEEPSNKIIIAKGLSLKNYRREYNPLEVLFYNAESAKVWG
jgi:hypothetical protein